jgi:hypothetical protein
MIHIIILVYKYRVIFIEIDVSYIVQFFLIWRLLAPYSSAPDLQPVGSFSLNTRFRLSAPSPSKREI